MIVTCPSCSVRYLVDARALGPAGRTVRCARCAHTWHQDAPADAGARLVDAPPPPAPEAPSPSLEARDAAPSLTAEPLEPREPRVQLPALPRKEPRWGLAAARIVGAMAIVGGVAYAAVVERQRVVEFVPGTAQFYADAGFPVADDPGSGLEFRNVTTSREMENGLPALVIEGEVRNVSSSARDVPKLVVILRDKSERDLQDLTVAAPANRLMPGQSVPFKTSITQPAEAASGVVVTFKGSDRG
jgi:predicted Zn finger-like uncharacterized protein